MFMAELRCGVVTCAHNKLNYCELEGIEVMGNCYGADELLRLFKIHSR